MTSARCSQQLPHTPHQAETGQSRFPPLTPVALTSTNALVQHSQMYLLQTLCRPPGSSRLTGRSSMTTQVIRSSGRSCEGVCF